jgi:nucleoside-diphosphate-sugar epimerase
MSLHLDTPYQITKLLGELYCNFFHDQYGLPIVNARFFNVYGPGEIPGRYRNVIPNFIYWALEGKPLPITGTGEETRDFTYVSDIVEGILACGLMDAAVGEAINLASGIETQVIEIAETVNSLAGNPAGVTLRPRRGWDKVLRRRASIAKARRILGYEPRTGMEHGLRMTFDWIKSNWERIEACVAF